MATRVKSWEEKEKERRQKDKIQQVDVKTTSTTQDDDDDNKPTKEETDKGEGFSDPKGKQIEESKGNIEGGARTEFISKILFLIFERGGGSENT